MAIKYHHFFGFDGIVCKKSFELGIKTFFKTIDFRKLINLFFLLRTINDISKRQFFS